MGATRYKPYPAYKPSGVEWLGDIPEGWEAKRLGNLFEERREKVSDKDYPPLSVTMQGIVPQLETAAKSLDSDNRKLVKAGDFVINSRSDRKGSAGLSELDGSVTLISNVLKPKNIEGAFAHHLLKSYPFQEEYYRFGKGIVADLWSTNFNSMKNITLPVVPIEEQTKIAAFLDYEAGRIDALIAKQERLIALLEEKRQAVISHAVTKGLNPNAPLRPSGIDWLGDVPEHWKTTRLKFISSIFGRIGFRGYTVDDIVEEGEGAIVLSPSNIQSERFSLAKKTFLSWKKYYESPEIMVSAGDVLLVKTGSTFGKSTFVSDVEEPMTINPQMALLKVQEGLAQIVAFFLSTAFIKATVTVSNTGSGMPTMTQENIGGFPICFGPIEEIQAIETFLTDAEKQFDLLLTKAQSAIALLKERRTALISAAVTGKIDVRDWQAPELVPVHNIDPAKEVFA